MPYVNKAYFYVPCGKCESCRLSMQSDWMLRARAHTQDYPWAYVYTLTYRENDVPYFIDNEYNCKVMAFSHKDIKDFLDNIRKYMLRWKMIEKGDMNYYIASEYGEGKYSPEGIPSTHRPHYHMILYFKQKQDFKRLHNLIRQFWAIPHGYIFPDIKTKEIGSKYWWNTLPSENQVLARDKDACAKYISKYTTKDIGFYKKEEIQKYLDEKLKKTNKAEWEKRYWRIKRYLPKHWQSKGFGISLLNEVKKKPEYYLTGGKFIDIKDLKKYKMPKYITDKVAKINCIHLNKPIEHYEDFKREFKALQKKWNKYEKMTDDDIKRMRVLRSHIRPYTIETRNTKYYNKILLSNFERDYRNTIQKFEDFVKNTKYSNRYKTKQYLELKNTKELEMNENNIAKHMTFYIKFIQGREKSFNGINNISYILNNFDKNITETQKDIIESIYTNMRRKKERIGKLIENTSEYTPYRQIFNEYRKWQSDKIKDEVKKLINLQIFYKQLKEKRRNYAKI